jgi:hypothetical protein
MVVIIPRHHVFGCVVALAIKERKGEREKEREKERDAWASDSATLFSLSSLLLLPLF